MVTKTYLPSYLYDSSDGSGSSDSIDQNIFTESAPLGRFSHRVAMSVCGSVCVCAPLGAFF